jgi:hypothetical protein
MKINTRSKMVTKLEHIEIRLDALKEISHLRPLKPQEIREWEVLNFERQNHDFKLRYIDLKLEKRFEKIERYLGLFTSFLFATLAFIALYSSMDLISKGQGDHLPLMVATITISIILGLFGFMVFIKKIPLQWRS